MMKTDYNIDSKIWLGKILKFFFIYNKKIIDNNLKIFSK